MLHLQSNDEKLKIFKSCYFCFACLVYHFPRIQSTCICLSCT